MRLLKNLTAALVLCAATGAAMADSDGNYTCQKNVFGCFTRYIGPTTPEAAQTYLTEASEAVRRVLDGYPAVASASYTLSRGELVLQMRDGQRIGGKTMLEIGQMFHDDHLYLEQVTVMDPAMRVVLGAVQMQGQNGGKSRFYALNDFSVQTKTSAPSPEVVAATNPVRRDVWGNTTIRLTP